PPHCGLPALFSQSRRSPPRPTLFPYTTLFRSSLTGEHGGRIGEGQAQVLGHMVGQQGSGMCRKPFGKSRIRAAGGAPALVGQLEDRKSTRLNSSHRTISYAVFCLKKKKKKTHT